MPILTAISVYISIIPLLVILLRYRHLTEIQKWISLIVVVAGLSEMSAQELKVHGFYNTPVIHVFVVLELALYTWIFHKSMPSRLPQKLAYFVMGGFALLSVLNSIFLQSIMELNSYARALESFTLILLSLTFFYHLLQEMEVYDLQRLPTFWVAAGVLVNFSVNLLYFSFMDWLAADHLRVFEVAKYIHSIANIILYLLLAIGLSVNPAKVKMA